MGALTELGRDLNRLNSACWLASIALLFGGAVTGCVGEQSGSAAEEQAGEVIELPFDPDEVLSGVLVDTTATFSYRTFEVTVTSESPRKVVYRLLTLEAGEPRVFAKTLRMALDSIARADSSLVAARAILYTFEPTGPRRGILTAHAWGEWLPLSGWDEAEAGHSDVPNRIYTYNQRPSWYRSLSGGS